MAQGFAIKNNLSESNTGEKDRNALNLLGGAGIADDITLFDGNLRHRSGLLGGEYEIQNVNGRSEFYVPTLGRTAFSEGSIVSYDGNEYKVNESNTEDRFTLVSVDPETGNETPFNPTDDTLIISTSNAITQENLFNINTPRQSVSTRSGQEGLDNDQDTNEESLLDLRTIEQNKEFISGEISILSFKRNRVIVTDSVSDLSGKVTLNGVARITNDDDVSIDVTVNPTAPGLYILSGDSAIRAFADATNPWIVNNAAVPPRIEASTETTTEGYPVNADAECQKLTLSPDSGSPPNLVVDTSQLVEEAITISNWTHKYPVDINGERYFLLLSEQV